MATIISAPLPRPTTKGEATLFAEFRAFWRAFVAKAFNPYRPELHYMRGPGPACQADGAVAGGPLDARRYPLREEAVSARVTIAAF